MARQLLAARLIGALLFGGTFGVSSAQGSGGPIAGDREAGTVRVNPGGTAPNGNARWNYDPGTGTVSFGLTQSGDGASSGSNSGGTATGPPVACVPTGVVVDGEVHLPTLKIATNPRRQGIVGLPSWFWSDGYSGRELRGQTVSGHYTDCVTETDADGNTHLVPRVVSVILNVDFWPVRWVWSFGDSKTQAGTCGQLSDPSDCPTDALGREDRPAVTNVYQSSSANFPDGYPVDLSVTFAGRIGSPDHWAPLGPFEQHADLDFPVREVQSVLVP